MADRRVLVALGIAGALLLGAFVVIEARVEQGLELVSGFGRAMAIAAGLAAVGSVLAFVTIRRGAFVRPVGRANPAIPCYDAGVRIDAA